MLELWTKLVGWILSLWGSIPDAAKEKIINIIVESFDSILRAFFKSAKSEGEV